MAEISDERPGDRPISAEDANQLPRCPTKNAAIPAACCNLG
jgi:hypothetical protein